MSDEELVEAYVEGRITRRMFVRRLVAGGLSVAAAVTYADALLDAPAAEAKQVKPAHLQHHIPRRRRLFWFWRRLLGG